MSVRLHWRSAQRRDRVILQQFTCTVGPKWDRSTGLSLHPKPWEREVQSWIRETRPPVGPDQALLLGEDAEGLAAVSMLADQGDPSVVKIQAIAVATRYRGQGGEFADEAMHVVLETVVERARQAGFRNALVVGWIDPRNVAGRSLNQRVGFTHRRNTPTGLEEWVFELECRPAEPERR